MAALKVLLNIDQFNYLIEGKNLQQTTIDRMKAIFVDGVEVSDLSNQTGISRQSVHKMCRKFMSILDEKLQAEGLESTFVIAKSDVVTELREKYECLD